MLHEEHLPVASLAYWLDCSVGSESRVTALVGEGGGHHAASLVCPGVAMTGLVMIVNGGVLDDVIKLHLLPLMILTIS